MDDPIADPETIISCRVRLMRNLARFPFVDACSRAQLAQIENCLRASGADLDSVTWVNPGVDPAAEIQRWRNRLLQGIWPAAWGDVPQLEEAETRLWLSPQDHLMIEVERPDHDLDHAWTVADAIDDHFDRHQPWAFSRRWGYLTSSPADVGTGLRVSAVLHLPALAITGQIEKVFRSLPRANLVGRCLPPELDPELEPLTTAGAAVNTGLFRIGNQATLGHTEAGLIEQVRQVLPMLVRLEEQARRSLLDRGPWLRPQFRVAVHKLERLNREGDWESPRLWLALLSQIRLGMSLGMIPENQLEPLGRGLWLTQRRQQLHQAVAEEQYGKAAQLRDQIQLLQSQFKSPGDQP